MGVIRARAEEEAGSGLLSVKDLVANIPPMSARSSRSARVFSVGLHSPPSPAADAQEQQRLPAAAAHDVPVGRARSAAVAASMQMLLEQVQPLL